MTLRSVDFCLEIKGRGRRAKEMRLDQAYVCDLAGYMFNGTG
jgi:hypothetical protein